MKYSEKTKGHLSALISVLIWGTTFVASKSLLSGFRPFEIIFFRFLFGFIVLFLINPRILKTKSWKEELLFILAGFSGVTLCFGFEMIALNYTTASNVGIIVSVSPFFTAIFAKIFLKEDSIHKNFIIGGMISLIGIVVISTQGNINLKINILGDMLAFFSAVCWAIYSLISKKISALGYYGILVTRRIFFYGLLFMLPFIFFSGSSVDLPQLLLPSNMLNLLFLGIGASALCFFTWNVAIHSLGAVKTSVYMYLVPIVSVASSALLIGEKITVYSVIGILLIIVGLVVSDRRIIK